MQCGLASIVRCIVLGLLTASIAGAPAVAIMGGGGEREETPPNDEYAQGKAAFEREDWPAVIEHMTRAIAERPWDDDAHNLMGFAYRKLGDYDRALEQYDRALALNPHHRGALEYLGEAYLEMDQPELAKGLLDRLVVECQRLDVSATDGGWQANCDEWQDLNEAYRAYVAGGNGK
jgi:tetratricopeptide (TPR) repeat protein